jgi:hypothetical protein
MFEFVARNILPIWMYDNRIYAGERKGKRIQTRDQWTMPRIL